MSDVVRVIELWPHDVDCGECGASGQWHEAREWYEGEPATGSRFYVWICPACLPLVDAKPVSPHPQPKDCCGLPLGHLPWCDGSHRWDPED